MIIFLDIDGVLNDHTPLPSRYCGIKLECVHNLNKILDAIPEARIVISSAWRYLILRGEMNLKGFEMLLLVSGVKCWGKVVGHTEPDGRIEDEPDHHDNAEAWHTAGLKWRVNQIEKWVAENNVGKYIIIDDLPLIGNHFYQTDGTKGLTETDAENIIRLCKVN